MNIYDCFMYFDEDLLLDLRLNVLNNFVKKFVITEATYTHNGSKKKLQFDINKFKKSINSILKYTDKHKLDRPIDNYLTHLHNKRVVKTLVWDGKKSDSGMFCGIYDQLDTYCDKRVSVMGEHFHN